MNLQGGLISPTAKRKIRNTIDFIIFLAKPKKFHHNKYKKKFTFKINFLTLTLSSPQIHSDQTIKSELLDHFILQAKRKWNLGLYMWRAESQSNGNIHFHFVTDTFIPWSECRDLWNNIQNKLGYVDRFREKHTGKWPNSVDVKSVKKIRNLSKYLSKYCAKNTDEPMYTPIKWVDSKPVAIYNPSESENLGCSKPNGYRAIGGRLWGCSQQLSKLQPAGEYCMDEARQAVQAIKDAYPDCVYESSYCMCIYVNAMDWGKAGGQFLFDFLTKSVNLQLESMQNQPIKIAA